MAYVYIPTAGRSRPAGASARLVRRLLSQGATSQWSARPLELKRGYERAALEASLASGMIHRTDEGTYWVDEEKWARWRRKQLRIVVVAVMAVFLMFAILFVLGEFP
jgi:hypothetical protein